MISCIPKVLTVLIDLGISGSSLIIICSPATNTPVTWVNLTTALAPPDAIANPVAPLLNPLTNDVLGSSALVTAWLSS